MYKIALKCENVPSEAASAARDIEEHFCQSRQHHQNVRCYYDSNKIFLIAENDYDERGFALMDEFSDALSAYMQPFDGDIKIISVEIF